MEHIKLRYMILMIRGMLYLIGFTLAGVQPSAEAFENFIKACENFLQTTEGLKT